jgi:hypothetical protein
MSMELYPEPEAGPQAGQTSRARQVAEKAKPHMRVVEQPIQDAETLGVAPDATVPDDELVQRKYGVIRPDSAVPVNELHMVVMEPKNAVDARTGHLRRTLIVDDNQVVGEEG